MEQNRFRSWAVWLSMASLIALIAKTYFGYEIPNWDAMINSVLMVLTGFGILNNPTVSDKF